MIGYIKGTMEELLSDGVLLENNGIGYKIFTSGMVIEQMSGIHGQVKLYTYMHVREDEISLFGFPTKEELFAFQLLLGVNGIGPKAALSVLSVLSVRDLAFAVMTGDTKAITRANGIGAKGANRIIMELKDKLTIDEVFGDTDIEGTYEQGSVETQSDSVKDTVLALVSLGYSEFEALKAVRQIPDAGKLDSDALLKQALKQM